MIERELDPGVQWIVAELRRPVEVDGEARARLLDAIRAEPLPRRGAAPWRWAVRPRSVSLPPLATAALAAGLVGVGVLVGMQLRGRAETPLAAAEPAREVRFAEVARGRDLLAPGNDGMVKFILVAPQAARVAVVGDFNGWNASATPMRRTGGTWSVVIPLEPGRHVYAFVVNGTQWMADPAAPLAPDDGYGVSNSVVLVGGSSS